MEEDVSIAKYRELVQEIARNKNRLNAHDTDIYIAINLDITSAAEADLIDTAQYCDLRKKLRDRWYGDE